MVVQAKYRSRGTLLGSDPVHEVAVSAGRYDAQIAVVATNTGFTETALSSAEKNRQRSWVKDTALEQ